MYRKNTKRQKEDQLKKEMCLFDIFFMNISIEKLILMVLRFMHAPDCVSFVL